jgi:hypothetical protein
MDKGGVSYPVRYEATSTYLLCTGAQAEAERYSLLAQLRSLLPYRRRVETLGRASARRHASYLPTQGRSGFLGR